jgi:septal ring factor EnvC (AmiA/AmiB activator)
MSETINEMSAQDKCKMYLQINKEIAEYKKKNKDQKKILQNLEKDIHEYMLENDMNSIQTKDGEIVMYDKKKSETFKVERITECLKEKLNCDESKANVLAESILSNKVFTTEKKIKANIKGKESSSH